MSLKQSIIVVNEFTVKKASGGGTRGATPGKYVTRYMARTAATEPVAPIKAHRLDNFITRYMARADAVDEAVNGYQEVLAGPDGDDFSPVDYSSHRGRLSARRSARSFRRHLEKNSAVGIVGISNVIGLKKRFREAQGYGGVAFSDFSVSMSDEELTDASDAIQRHFDNGRTVLKTVVSFDHDYLVDNGLVPADMSTPVHRGDYRGQLDQMKLRSAIRTGLTRMERHSGFDKLVYVGVIQVDTKHVHCHLAMVDAGDGDRRRTKNGEQRGKLSPDEIRQFRRGADSYLDMTRSVPHLSSAVNYEKRNVATWVKKWAYETLSVEAPAQFLVACLPGDKTQWRAGSNAKVMEKPNRIVRELVEERLARPDSPMRSAMSEVITYATERTAREGLSETENRKLIDNGYERIINSAMNGVYSVLSSLPDTERTVETEMLAVMSEDFEGLLDGITRRVAKKSETEGVDESSSSEMSDFDGFALRLSGYSARLANHIRMQRHWQLRLDEYEQYAITGALGSGSEAMRAFYVSEIDYHSRCVGKYQHFLDFAPTQVDWKGQWAEVSEYGRRLTGLVSLRSDRSLAGMKDPEVAEELGRQMYGQPGGGLLTGTGEAGRVNRRILDTRIEAMRTRYRAMVDEVKLNWSEYFARPVVIDAEVTETAGAGEPGVRPGRSGEGSEVVFPVTETGLSGHPESVGMPAGSTPDIYTPGVSVGVDMTPEWDFETVKGADMHDMRFDWTVDQPVGSVTAGHFDELHGRRDERLRAAVGYMVASGQEEEIESELGEAIRDVTKMGRVNAQIRRSGLLRSQLGLMVRRRRAEDKERAEQAAAAAERAAVEAAETAETAEAVESAEVAGAGVSEPPKTGADTSVTSSTGRSRTFRLDRQVNEELLVAVDRAVEQTMSRITDRGLGE